MNDLGKYVVYFFLGGTIVSLSTYLGAQGRPYLAAFASTFPAITGATFVLLYLNGGSDAIVAYAEKLFWFVPVDRLRHGDDFYRAASGLLARNGAFPGTLYGMRVAPETGAALTLPRL